MNARARARERERRKIEEDGSFSSNMNDDILRKIDR